MRTFSATHISSHPNIAPLFPIRLKRVKLVKYFKLVVDKCVDVIKSRLLTPLLSDRLP